MDMLPGKRWESFQAPFSKLPVAMGLQWHAEILNSLIVGAAVGVSKFFRGIVSTALVFSTVKGPGFGDWGESGLSPHELKMNGLPVLTKSKPTIIAEE